MSNFILFWEMAQLTKLLLCLFVVLAFAFALWTTKECLALWLNIYRLRAEEERRRLQKYGRF